MNSEIISVNKQELLDLVYYCDICAGILKENGYPGKAVALEERYLKFNKVLSLTQEYKTATPI